ncbi:MAG: hypothetical protein AB1325_09750 [Nitrospirota bacterium]
MHRDIYALKALSQIPRLLSNQDRNPFSSTYGCFHRDYWLDKTSDFPDAVRQFAVHALAMVYKFDFHGNIYKGQSKVRDWAIAGLEFWAKIQHKDGSFDEFYPYERGWVGPTAFTTFTSIEAYNLLKDEMPDDVADRVLSAIRKAARFIIQGESEEDHLANHHAMACLAVWKAFELFPEQDIKSGYDRLWKGFLQYHIKEEGWSREYDGVDPGYLSATVSFLAKIYQTNPSPEILEVLKQSVEFCSYFVYPNGFYAGSAGSRNTLHFYPHGFEILSDKIPLAASIAEEMLNSLSEYKLVPPEIISDRYVVYRVPEFLQAYLDYKPRKAQLPPLPFERGAYTKYFPLSRIFISNNDEYYIVANIAKGGVVKVFSRKDGKLLYNDCGLIGKLEDGRIVTSQWIDPDYKCEVSDDGWEAAGYLNTVPSNKLFTPLRNILFRCTMIVLGRIPAIAHLIKGYIRKMLILGQRTVPIRFRRSFKVNNGELILKTEVDVKGNVQFSSLAIGDEFFVRYVPQSRYFQTQELQASGMKISADMLNLLRKKRRLHVEARIRENQIIWDVL